MRRSSGQEPTAHSASSSGSRSMHSTSVDQTTSASFWGTRGSAGIHSARSGTCSAEVVPVIATLIYRDKDGKDAAPGRNCGNDAEHFSATAPCGSPTMRFPAKASFALNSLKTRASIPSLRIFPSSLRQTLPASDLRKGPPVEAWAGT